LDDGVAGIALAASQPYYVSNDDSVWNESRRKAKKGMTGYTNMKNSINTVFTRPAFCVMMLLPIIMVFTTGCKVNSWFDPSVVGRWDKTPAVAPIIDRLDVVEPAEKEFVETVDVTPSDLIPDIQAYSIGSSDSLFIDIFELFEPGTPYNFQRVVDDTGNISIPLIGSVHVEGLSESQAQRIIADRLSPDILRDPQVSVVVQNKTKNRFSISGPAGAGLIDITNPRYHLTDALAAYGSTPDNAEYIYIIRQIPLDDVIMKGTSRGQKNAVSEIDQSADENINNQGAKSDETKESEAEPADTGQNNGQADETGDETQGNGVVNEPDAEIDLSELIDELTEAGSNTKTVVTQPQDNNIDNIVSTDKSEAVANQGATINKKKKSEADQPSDRPALQVPQPGEGEHPSKWVYLNGQWVRVELKAPIAKETAEPGDLVTDLDISKLVTQRVIRVPVKPLLQGVAGYNIIIRPNDIIRIPSPETGIIYLQGEIARPGSFALPTPGRSTLIRAIAGAGGLAPLAIPERIDIIRMLPNNRQATVRINFRAVMDMTEPDIYLKPGDVINVGTSWFAAPLAVIRNGFRTSYGFGFLLDRNFGTDVFGAPPSSTTR